MLHQKKNRMITYSLVIVSMLAVGVAIGSFNSNTTTVSHDIVPFSPVLSLLIDGLIDFGTKTLFIPGSETPPVGANVATDAFTWSSSVISGPHNLVLIGTVVSGGFTLADLVVDCGSGPITGSNPTAITGQYVVSVDATIDSSITCTFTYAGGPRTINWSHSIVDA